MSVDLCGCWIPLRSLPTLPSQRAPQTDGCWQNESKAVRPDAGTCIIASTLALVLHCIAWFKMRCIILKHSCHHRHPGLHKMSIFILWAEFVWCVCYIQFRCIPFRFKVTKMRWKNSTLGTWKLPLRCQDRMKQSRETLHCRVKSFDCHGTVTLCVGHHYDNKHSSTFHGRPSL